MAAPDLLLILGNNRCVLGGQRDVCPVAFRFRTYDIAIEGATARAHCETLLALPAMREWERAAAVEVEELARAALATKPERAPDPISSWDSLEAIRAWKDVPEQAAVQARGKNSFYERYKVGVATVDRGYKFPT